MISNTLCSDENYHELMDVVISSYIYLQPTQADYYLQLGSLRFAHLFFVNNSALDASIFKISVPIIKRSS